ncbi:hypothetical protein RDWZM_008438 [Blomia tropicalis]|uniref:acetyl-CoA C-acyltransferase n=1 Tax=Blomia tropicalis TaxID=40697 RepID=A0A9Q0RK30_BLOTA|nr:hypothetical protein RDWZM_008438 [Blomia tropicalis]
MLSHSASRWNQIYNCLKPSFPIISNSSGYHFDNHRYGKNIVLVEGVRTPFAITGTYYENMSKFELQKEAIVALMNRVNIPRNMIDYVICGTAMVDSISNVAKEATLAASLPSSIAAHSVTQACITANQTITSAIGYINSGTYEIVICGGVESLVDPPIRHSRKMRKLMLAMNKAKTKSARLKLLSTIRPDYFIPEVPAIEDYFTGETAGGSADRLAASFKVSRREQDEYGLRSHQFADNAFRNGFLIDIEPLYIADKRLLVDRDNGVRVSTMDKVSSLKPAFDRSFGTATAANSSFLTDGASACLIMTEQKAKELGLKPKAFLRQHMYASQDPKDQLLLGPAYVTSRLLDRVGLKVSDIDVWEFHEAFAGQVLANLKAMDSEYFSRNFLRRSEPLGMPDMNRFNLWGGSLSIGHPFGATGIRIVTTAANRLIKENGRLAFVTACAGGGIGHGIIIERYH